MENKTRYKTISILSITLALFLFVIGPALFVYIIDPFQIYHKPFFSKQKFSADQIYQHAGWINRLLADPQENYQAILIGSSTMGNYTEAMINEHLPWGKTMNLSVNGGFPRMDRAIAEHALSKNNHIKHILWDISFHYVFPADLVNEDKEALKFPYYLYNHNLLDDYPYLFNISNIVTGFKFLLGNFYDFSYGVEDNGPFYQGFVNAGYFTIYGSQENLKNNLLPELVDVHWHLPDKEFYPNTRFSSIDHYMLDVLLPLCNTDRDIDIIFSPPTRQYYAALGEEFLDRQLYMRRYVVEHTQACNNIRVFAFDNLDWIVNDLGSYADTVHFKISINNYILESVAKNDNRLTMENIDQYETRFIDNINNYKGIFLAGLKQP